MNHAYSEQPFLVDIRGKMNSTGHCIWIVQNIIVSATLMDVIELSHNSLDAVLGETVTEIKVRPSLSIQTSPDNAHEYYSNSLVKTLYCFSEYPSSLSIQCKILLEICAEQQVLGLCGKLISETLLPETYAGFAEMIQEL